MSESSSLIGRSLGKYEIVELLGSGGMATVYKAYQTDVDRHVAVKVLPPHPGQTDQFIERFRLEARTIARLQHPHILPLYDYGNQDNILYLVMSLAGGGSLSDRLKAGGMPLADISALLKQVASAMDYAHRQGIVHRDIKPGNILIDSEGHALLADFGLVRLMESDENLTATGGVLGTPAYMAPEQARGMPVSSSIDIYALGVVVYEMLTGKQPYTAETGMQVVLMHVTEPVPDIEEVVPGLPPELGLVMRRVMSKEPDERYPNATAFAEAFERAIRANEATESLVMESFGDLPPVSREKPGATTEMLTRPATREPRTPEPKDPSQPTIIVQNQTSPAVLIGGTALIAVLVAVLAVLVVMFVLNGDDTPTATPGGVAIVATDTSDEPDEAIAPTPVPQPTFGMLTFGSSSDTAIGDTVTLRVEGLTPPGSGNVYVAWLLPAAGGDPLGIGEVSIDALGDGVLAFTDPEGRMLPGIYNAISITVQEAPDDPPSSEVAYSGGVPPEVAVALNEILLESEDGISGGSLLEGAITEASIAAQHAGLAQSAGSVASMHTHAEHTVNILNGTEEDLNGDGRPQNPGRGVGVFFFLDAISSRLDEAVAASDATLSLQQDAEFIRVCLFNARGWAEEIEALERELLAAEDIAAVEAEALRATELVEILINGQDFNENGRIESFEAECGLRQISTFSVLFASMDIVEGALQTDADESETALLPNAKRLPGGGFSVGVDVAKVDVDVLGLVATELCTADGGSGVY